MCSRLGPRRATARFSVRSRARARGLRRGVACGAHRRRRRHTLACVYLLRRVVIFAYTFVCVCVCRRIRYDVARVRSETRARLGGRLSVFIARLERRLANVSVSCCVRPVGNEQRDSTIACRSKCTRRTSFETYTGSRCSSDCNDANIVYESIFLICYGILNRVQIAALGK